MNNKDKKNNNNKKVVGGSEIRLYVCDDIYCRYALSPFSNHHTASIYPFHLAIHA